MNVVETIARFLWQQDADQGRVPTKKHWTSDRSYELHPVDFCLLSAPNDWTDRAEEMLAAFPQLALEGHEEWGGIDPLTRQVLGPFATYALQTPTHKRTVYTSPWQEVQP